MDGLKTPVMELTPGPIYSPPRGLPPFRLKGPALMVVISLKQEKKVTTGDGATVIVIVPEVAGLEFVQGRLEVITQVIWSPAVGVKEKDELFTPVLTLFTFH